MICREGYGCAAEKVALASRETFSAQTPKYLVDFGILRAVEAGTIVRGHGKRSRFAELGCLPGAPPPYRSVRGYLVSGSVRQMDHPCVIRPGDHAVWQSSKMGKSTLFESARLLVGLNAFEPGQSHALHAHAGIDKLYHVLEGRGVFLLDGRELEMGAGDLLVAPQGVAHGVRNDGPGRLLVLAVLAPAP